MDVAAKESLSRRVAQLHLQVGETLRASKGVTERARSVSEQTAQARRRRWTIRYEQALERKTKELGDLTLDD